MITAQNMRDFVETNEALSVDDYIDNRLAYEARNAQTLELSSGWIRVYIEDQYNAAQVVDILENRGFTVDNWNPDYVLTCDIEFSW